MVRETDEMDPCINCEAPGVSSLTDKSAIQESTIIILMNVPAFRKYM